MKIAIDETLLDLPDMSNLHIEERTVKAIYIEDSNMLIFMWHSPLHDYAREIHYAKLFSPDKISTYSFLDCYEASYEVVAIDEAATITVNLIDEDEVGWLRYLVVCKGVELRRLTSHRDETPLPAYLEIIKIEHI